MTDGTESGTADAPTTEKQGESLPGLKENPRDHPVAEVTV